MTIPDSNSQEGGKLQGEGDVQNVRRTRRRHECEVCGEPADYRHSFLLENARRNPASAAYGRDDCSWCSDAETFVCQEHHDKRNAPDGHEWAGTFTLAKLPHMGLYWHEEVQSPTPSQEGRSSLSVEGGDVHNEEHSEIEAVIACLGDDAAQLRQENDEDERADNMDRAAQLLQQLLDSNAAVARLLLDQKRDEAKGWARGIHIHMDHDGGLTVGVQPVKEQA